MYAIDLRSVCSFFGPDVFWMHVRTKFCHEYMKADGALCLVTVIDVLLEGISTSLKSVNNYKPMARLVFLSSASTCTSMIGERTFGNDRIPNI